MRTKNVRHINIDRLRRLVQSRMAARIAAYFARKLIAHFPSDVRAAQYERNPVMAFRQVGYSQEGEDLVLSRIFDGMLNGYCVDIGAHHPVRFSNTYLLYKRGWRAINVDAAPAAMKEFRQLRPDDINIDALVSSSNVVVPFYMFDELVLNTASRAVAARR